MPGLPIQGANNLDMNDLRQQEISVTNVVAGPPINQGYVGYLNLPVQTVSNPPMTVGEQDQQSPSIPVSQRGGAFLSITAILAVVGAISLVYVLSTKTAKAAKAVWKQKLVLGVSIPMFMLGFALGAMSVSNK